MEKEALIVYKRDEDGAKTVKELRREGYTPIVVYGKEYASTSLKINTLELNKFLTDNAVGSTTDMQVDGNIERVMLKEVQRHPVSKEVIHVDFQQLKAGLKIRTDLPIHLTNADKLHKDLVVQKLMDIVNIESLPKDLVDSIEIDVASLALGDSICVKDIDMSKYPGIEIKEDEDAMILNITDTSSYNQAAEPSEEAEDTDEATEESSTEE